MNIWISCSARCRRSCSVLTEMRAGKRSRLEARSRFRPAAGRRAIVQVQVRLPARGPRPGHVRCANSAPQGFLAGSPRRCSVSSDYLLDMLEGSRSTLTTGDGRARLIASAPNPYLQPDPESSAIAPARRAHLLARLEQALMKTCIRQRARTSANARGVSRHACATGAQSLSPAARSRNRPWRSCCCRCRPWPAQLGDADLVSFCRGARSARLRLLLLEVWTSPPGSSRPASTAMPFWNAGATMPLPKSNWRCPGRARPRHSRRSAFESARSAGAFGPSASPKPKSERFAAHQIHSALSSLERRTEAHRPQLQTRQVNSGRQHRSV